jgi:hypothetical protein
MIDFTELRIGNTVYIPETKTPIIVRGISEQGFIITKNEFNEYENVSLEQTEPLILTQNYIDKLLNHGIILNIDNNNIFHFAGLTATYFLVYDEDEENFFIGMIDTELPEKYRRITRPFIEFHKLQNAYYTIYNKELKKVRL